MSRPEIPVAPGDPWWLLKVPVEAGSSTPFQYWLLWHFNLFCVKHVAEILASLAGVLGWLLVTLAVAQIAPPGIVYLASAGLFCLTLFGWGFLYEIGRKGIYSLSKGRK